MVAWFGLGDVVGRGTKEGNGRVGHVVEAGSLMLLPWNQTTVTPGLFGNACGLLTLLLECY
jgi:hypothetical protein